MNTDPAVPKSLSLPPNPRQSGSRNVRALGWALVFIGPCLSVAMLLAGGSLFDVLHQNGRHLGSSRWHGGPEFTRLVFELFGAVFLLGVGIFAGGLYQIVTGRRHPVLVGIVLLLAAVTVYFVGSILSAQSTTI